MNDSPFYTAAKPIAGQEEIPLGTVHLCYQCKSDYVCDEPACRLNRITAGKASPCCAHKNKAQFTQHSQHNANVSCDVCLNYGCTTKHVRCPSCGHLDGYHRNCPTQLGHQFGLGL